MDVLDLSPNFTRRDFIKTALAAGVFTQLPFYLGGPKRKVIIIGAGMAGISAAQALMKSGFEVEILEARSRIGGRIHSVTTPTGKVLELGANWIHEPARNPVVALCQQYGLHTSPSDNWTDIQKYSSRGLFSEQETKEINDLYQSQIDLLSTLRMTRDQSLWAAIESKILPYLNPRQVSQFLHMCRTNIEDEYGAALDQISFQTWKQETKLRIKESPAHDLTIDEGYGRLIELMAKDMNIHLNTIVQKVTLRQDGVTVQTLGREWQADQVIVTVPLGVLKNRSIEFSPPLPDRHQQVIDRIGFGRFEKVVLTSSERFWPDDKTWLEYFSDDPVRVASFFNHDRLSNSKTLVGLATGQLVKAWPRLTDSERLQKTLSALAPLSGPHFNPVDFQSTSWCEDPFSMGSYSFPAVDQKLLDRRILTEPIAGRLHFAGEATNLEDYGTVNGAYLSGQDVATKIMEFLF